MKKIKELFLFLLMLMVIMQLSCDQEDHEIIQESIGLKIPTPVNIDNSYLGKAARITDEKVYRYFSGGSLSLHTYRTQSGTGSIIGNSEGIAFVTPTSTTDTRVDRTKYNYLWFLIHPQNQDFLMTTNNREFWELRGKGWRNVTYRYILIQKGPGNGTRKLYRFYNPRSTDHLFTKNYTEGINAGLTYEGVVGWVK